MRLPRRHSAPHPAIPIGTAADAPLVSAAGIATLAHELGLCSCHGRQPLTNCPDLVARAEEILVQEAQGLTPPPIAAALRARLGR